MPGVAAAPLRYICIANALILGALSFFRPNFRSGVDGDVDAVTSARHPGTRSTERLALLTASRRQPWYRSTAVARRPISPCAREATPYPMTMMEKTCQRD